MLSVKASALTCFKKLNAVGVACAGDSLMVREERVKPCSRASLRRVEPRIAVEAAIPIEPPRTRTWAMIPCATAEFC